MAQWGTTDTSDDHEEPIRMQGLGQRLDAPWTDEQVTNLNRFQTNGSMHPFTCGGSVHDGSGGGRPSLVAQTDGWSCPDPACDYRQSWAHSFMADASVLDDMDEQRSRLFGEFFDQQRMRRRGAAKMRDAHQPQGTHPPDDLVEAACKVMHDAYEKAALGTGWATNPESRKPWSDVPEANKATMRASVTALFTWLATAAPGARLILHREEPPT